MLELGMQVRQRNVGQFMDLESAIKRQAAFAPLAYGHLAHVQGLGQFGLVPVVFDCAFQSRHDFKSKLEKDKSQQIVD